MEDEDWISDCAFITDMSEHFNTLNRRLQGRNQNIVHMFDMVNSFVTMTDVWKTQLKERELHHFPCLKSLSTISVEKMKQYCDILDIVITEFKDRRFGDFKNMENDFSLFANPFTMDILKVRPDLQLEVSDLQNDTFIKGKCKDLVGFDIYKNIDPTNFPGLRKFAVRTEAMFGSTYTCEQFFSKMNTIKSCKRSRLSDESLHAQITVAAYDETPDFKRLLV